MIEDEELRALKKANLFLKEQNEKFLQEFISLRTKITLLKDKLNKFETLFLIIVKENA